MLQTSMLLITVVGIVDHVIIIPMLLQSAGRDSWVSTLLSGMLLFLWTALLYVIIKKTEQKHLFLWLKERCGAAVAWPFAIILAIGLFSVGEMAMIDVSNWANITYLPTTPRIVITSTFALLCFYAANSGITAIAITNGILLPLVVVFGWFVALSNIPNKNYALLYPVFEHGWEPVLSGMLYAGAGFSGLFWILALQHRVKTKVRLLPMMITAVILIELTLSPLTGAIAEFGPYEAARQRFPAFEEWRLITFGHFLEHVDFLVIYQWLVGSFIYTSLAMCLIPEVFNIPQGKKRTWMLAILFVIHVAASEIPINDIAFFSILSKFYIPYSVIYYVGLSLVLFAIVAINGKRT
jgi:spore germination protein (amino acid permease)